MPFTLSHPLVVVPLRRLGLPLSALAIGAMVPDVVLFVPLPVGYDLTHSPRGLVTVDLVIGLLLCALWTATLRAPLHDAAPAVIRDRIPAPPLRVPLPRPRSVLLAAAGVVLGSLTHVLWDSFTHGYGIAVRHLPVLRAEAPLFPVYQWLQYISSVLGLLGVLVIIAVVLARRTPRSAPRRSPVGGAIVLAAPCVMGVAAVAAIIVGLGRTATLHGLVYGVATGGVATAALGLLAGCVLWWVLIAWGAPKLSA